MASKNSPDQQQSSYPFTSPGVPGGGIAPVTSSIVKIQSVNNLPHLNEKQLAERWGVSVRTLQAARVKGSGVPFVRIGRSVRYRLEDVLAYEEARLRTNTSETV